MKFGKWIFAIVLLSVKPSFSAEQIICQGPNNFQVNLTHFLSQFRKAHQMSISDIFYQNQQIDIKPPSDFPFVKRTCYIGEVRFSAKTNKLEFNCGVKSPNGNFSISGAWIVKFSIDNELVQIISDAKPIRLKLYDGKDRTIVSEAMECKIKSKNL